MSQDALQRLNQLPLRENLRELSPYGAPQIDVPVQLNVNENTHPLPQEVIDEITASVQAAARMLNRYPDREFTQLRTALAEYLGRGLTAENLWAANGSNEVLQQILQAFGGPGRTLLSFPPTYSMYPLLASGTDTTYIAGHRVDDYSLTAESAAEQVRAHKPNIVFLCSPNNPTGTGLELDVVKAVYEAGEESQTIVVVDEAYAEFAHDPNSTAITLLEGRQRLIISRTMSKAFGLAGARLGYLAAAPEISDALRLVRLPYHLSAVTQATALAALKHTDALLANVEAIKEQRDRIVNELKDMGLTPTLSDSNFVTFGDFEDPNDVFEYLLAGGVIIRNNGLPGKLRVTAGTEEETTQFLTLMHQYMERAQH